MEKFKIDYNFFHTIHEVFNTVCCLLRKNGVGDIIYSANNNAGIPNFPSVPFLTTGLVVDTLTSCTALIYTVPV